MFFYINNSGFDRHMTIHQSFEQVWYNIFCSHIKNNLVVKGNKNDKMSEQRKWWLY